MGNPIVDVLARKVDEDLVLIEDMLKMVPEGKGEWGPDWPSASGEAAFSVERLERHLVEACAGLCACFVRLHGGRLSQFEALKARVIAGEEPSAALIAACRAHIAEGFAVTTDADLSRLIVTYFAPHGEPILETLLANWKHVNHHEHQLFLYLKLLGVPVSTQHLYRFKTRD
jgi:hypothetical protein